MTDAELLALAERLERKIGADLLRALTRLRAGVPLSQVEAALIANDLDTATRLLGRERVVAALWDAQQAAAPVRESAFRAAFRQFARGALLDTAVDLTLAAHLTLNPHVAAAIRALDLSRIEGVTRQTDTALRETITRALTRGTPPREIARDLRTMLGLNSKQAAAVDRLRETLTAEGRPADQVERMVDRYARKQLRLRTENIARTETLTALNDGKQRQWGRLVDDGSINREDWVQVWVIAPDERVCPICRPFHRTSAPIGGLFYANATPEKAPPVATSSGPPEHPRCRCVVILQLAALYRRRTGVAA